MNFELTESPSSNIEAQDQNLLRPVSSVSEANARHSDDKFVVRFPDGMRDRIAQVAKTRHRSMNSEIVFRMQSTLDLEGEVARLKKIIDVLLSAQGAMPTELLAFAKEA